MQQAPLVLALALALSGCDAVRDLGAAVASPFTDHNPMTLYIQSGYVIQVGGERAPIFADGECPKADKFMKALFGPELHEGQRSCLVISAEADSVDVVVGFQGGPARETWTVERSADRTLLRRGDGSYVAAAN